MPNLLLLVGVLCAWADPPVTPPEVIVALEAALERAIERAEPSIVAIARTKAEAGDETLAVRGRNPASLQNDPRVANRALNLNVNPGGPESVSFDYGSGVVIGNAGEILTTFHVVKGAQRLEVRAAGRQAFEAEVLAADPRSDLAVIVPREGANLPPPRLRPIALGDAHRLRKGAMLLSLGNPFNAARDGQPSASWGILANVARRLEASYEDQHNHRLQLRHYPTLLQLDSKLNLGMSGGAVVNLQGEMVGLTTSLASAAGFDAMAGYAIPLDHQERQIIDALMQGKEYEYGFLGISLDPSGSNRVIHTQLGTPAGEGNVVVVDDQIMAVGEIAVVDADSLVLAINAMPAGTRVVLKILRQGQEIERTVELAKFPVRGEVIATNRPHLWRGLRVDYTSTLPFTTFGDPMLVAMARGGVAVTEVETGSPAAKAGLKPGQIIRSIEGKPLKNPRDFLRLAEDLHGPVSVETDQGPVTLR